jgi:hypothetical protein
MVNKIVKNKKCANFFSVLRTKVFGSSRVSRFSYNDKILKLKCSEAFAQVEAWEEIDESTGRYHDTFYPLAVVFTRCVRDNVSPLPYSDRMNGHHLKECLQGVLSASRKPLNGPIDWMPKGDEQVRTVLDRACLEVYANAGRVTQLSEMYVQRVVKKAARKLIGSCVRLNRGGMSSSLEELSVLLTQETVGLKVSLALATARVEEDEDYVRDCENHMKLTRRILNFEDL